MEELSDTVKDESELEKEESESDRDRSAQTCDGQAEDEDERDQEEDTDRVLERRVGAYVFRSCVRLTDIGPWQFVERESKDDTTDTAKESGRKRVAFDVCPDAREQNTDTAEGHTDRVPDRNLVDSARLDESKPEEEEGGSDTDRAQRDGVTGLAMENGESGLARVLRVTTGGDCAVERGRLAGRLDVRGCVGVWSKTELLLEVGTAVLVAGSCGERCVILAGVLGERTEREGKVARVWRQERRGRDVETEGASDYTEGATGGKDVRVARPLGSGQKDESDVEGEQEQEDRDGGTDGSDQEDRVYAEPGWRERRSKKRTGLRIESGIGDEEGAVKNSLMRKRPVALASSTAPGLPMA